MWYLAEWYNPDPKVWQATWEPGLIAGGTVETPLKLLVAYKKHNHAVYDESAPRNVDKADLSPNIIHCFPPWVGSKTLPRPPLKTWLSLLMISEKEFFSSFGKGARPGDVHISEIAQRRVDTYSWDAENSTFELLQKSKSKSNAKEEILPKKGKISPKKGKISPKGKNPPKETPKAKRPKARKPSPMRHLVNSVSEAEEGNSASEADEVQVLFCAIFLFLPNCACR
jgi:hypothetical protein